MSNKKILPIKIALLGMLTILLLLAIKGKSQTIGSTKTEQYKASFETKVDISEYMNYNGPTIPIQILKCGINDEMYEMYPELKEKFDRYLHNKEDDDTVREKLITSFFRGIGVEGLSNGNVSRIIQAGYDTVPKIINMTQEEFL